MAGEAADNGGTLGVARLSRMAFVGADLNQIWRRLLHSFVHEPGNAAALMDLSIVEQIFGNREIGIAHQMRALEIQQLFRSPCAARQPTLRLLAFAAPGDMGANAPLEFLLEASEIELSTLYLLPGRPLPEPLPEHDLAIVAIAESAEHRSQLEALEGFGARSRRPILNRPGRVLYLARERLCRLLAGAPGVAVPATVILSREELAAAPEGRSLATPFPAGSPLIVRPLDSHAGQGLERIEGPDVIASYLAARPELSFAVSQFVDYRSADGRYRKYRIVFVDGHPYAVHLAVADQWAIWYLNAGMKADPEKRAEEAHFMAAFDSDFGRRHRTALAAIGERVGLDYFAIDCAETADGKLLVFEADVAMIVHDMDDPAIYPYKGPQMRRIFAAFVDMLKKKVMASAER